MNAQNWCRSLAALALLLALCVSAGCASRKSVDLLLAQTQEQAKRAAITENVLVELAKRNKTVVADTLASVDKGSAVGWCTGRRAIRTATNEPLLDSAGNAQFEEYEAIGKSASVRDIAGYTEAEFRLAGFAFNNKDGVLLPNSLPEGLTLNLRGLVPGAATVSKEVAEVYMGAPGAEKTAILTGMANLATARGVAFATKVEAVSNGIAKVTTAVGEVTAQVLRATVLATPAGLAAEGAVKVVEALLRQPDDSLLRVVAVDTAETKYATALEESVKK